jgi:hypothetical protein
MSRHQISVKFLFVGMDSPRCVRTTTPADPRCRFRQILPYAPALCCHWFYEIQPVCGGYEKHYPRRRWRHIAEARREEWAKVGLRPFVRGRVSGWMSD